MQHANPRRRAGHAAGRPGDASDARADRAGEIRFKQTSIEALSFEVARLKRWRFGSSSESLDSTTQAVLFDAIVADTAIEDRAAQDEVTPPTALATKRQAVRRALPASLPRIDRNHEIKATHCECARALQRIGQEFSEQLDCVPAQFFVLRHIRGNYACPCCQTIQAAPMPAQMGTGQFFGSVGLNPGYLMALLAGAAEFFGGLALIFGVLVRPAAAALAVAMLIAIFAVHFEVAADVRMAR